MERECVGSSDRRAVLAGLRIIPEHDKYGVTADGRVWSRARGDEWRPLVTSLNTRGYEKVKLGHSRSASVNALVAAAFIGQRRAGMTIEHLDGNKRNAAASNLCYVTQAQANRRAWEQGSQRSGWPKRRQRLALMGFEEFGFGGSYPSNLARE